MAASYQVTKDECFICASESSKKLHSFECRHRICSKCLKNDVDGDRDHKMNRPRCPLCKRETLLKDVDVAGEEQRMTCEKHNDQVRNIYCEACKTLGCQMCILLEHSTHPTTELPKALDQGIREIQEMVSAVKENIKNLKSDLEASSKLCKTLKSNFEDTKRKISNKADREVRRIREKEQRLTNEAETVFKDLVNKYKADRGQKFTVIGHSKRKLDHVSKFMTTAKRSEILHRKEEVLNDLKELKERSQPKKSPGVLSFVDFEEVDRSLGRLVLEEEWSETMRKKPSLRNPPILFSTMKWKMTASITTYKHMSSERDFNFAFDVAVFPNDELVIGDIGNNHLVACSLLPLQSASSQATPRSLAIPEKLTIQGLLHPLKVAVNMESELIVVDNDSVKVHDREYCPLHKITPGKDTPLCLAVTDFNLIALGYINEICLFTQNGSKIRSFPAPRIGQYLATYKKCLIYTNYQERKLESLNLKGDRVFSVDLEVYGLPRGVCCDKDGSIFVAFGRGHAPGRIVKYSPDGRYMGCIIEECVEPWSIKLTPNGDLVIAAGKSVQIYQRA